MNEYIEQNRALWDELSDIHAVSDFYNIEGFKAGGVRLRDHEIEEVGDVRGKDLLHLMCHLGLDTMSWARLGARALGADFSERSIELARALAADLGVDARFVVSDVYGLPDVLSEDFDIVYTSRGVLGWLPDLDRWARVIETMLRPGGFFYVTEAHPLIQVFHDEEGTDELTLGYPYFDDRRPMTMLNRGSYANRKADVKHVFSHVWVHDMGQIVSSLTNAGLRIEFLHEFPFGDWEKPFLEKGEDGMWHLPSDGGEVPLSFSLGASKPV
jgi:SAM-dependent methyltransferase